MGVYDFLKGPCPDCGREIGEESGDIQIKWFSDLDNCFRNFRPGDMLPSKLEDGYYSLGDWPFCCNVEGELFAVVRGGRFIEFTRMPEGKTLDINYERHAMESAVEEVIKRYS